MLNHCLSLYFVHAILIACNQMTCNQKIASAKIVSVLSDLLCQVSQSKQSIPRTEQSGQNCYITADHIVQHAVIGFG